MTTESMKDESKQIYEKPNIKGDRLNVLLLIFLYVLQNIPSSLSKAIPLILHNRKASYAEQAGFSFVSYSYCFKLLWAPIVDCVYSRKIGRRKTWLVPTQYFIGLGMLLISMNVNDWLGSDDGIHKPKITLLTIMFFLCIFFASTQDVAVDGWALTMLQKRNIGHSGTCQSIGSALGHFLAFVLFIILDSKDFCNLFRNVPQDHGFVTFDNFIYFWSIVFIVSTTLIFIFKRDNSLDVIEDDCECKLGLTESYKHTWEILKVKPIQMISFILLTCRIGFGPKNGVAPLKLMDAGVPRDKFALLTIPSLPFQLILPFALSRYLSGRRPMRAYIVTYVVKIILSVLFAVLIFFTPYFQDKNKTLPVWYYCLLLLVYNLENLTKYVMGIATQSFFARISDPRFGGIYLTLMNTMINVGYSWPSTLSLWMVDWLTLRSCIGDKLQNMNSCYTILDGFYTESIFCAIIGSLWLCWGKKVIYRLEDMDPSLYVAEKNTDVIKDDKIASNTLLP